MSDGGNKDGSPSNNNINIGLQPREQRYGEGQNQRVWEIDYRGIKIGINLGDIAAAPTDAIMCPTTPWLKVGGGAIENRIARVSGNELFDGYTSELLRLLTQIRNHDKEVSYQGAVALSKFLGEKAGITTDNTMPELLRADILQATRMDELGEGQGEHVAVSYGASIPAPAGKELGKKGIKVVALTNVTPSGGPMIEDHMVTFTANSIKAAGLTGIDSITIPAVGTGFAAAFGFGMSQEESLRGFFRGAKNYADQRGDGSRIKRVDYNIYASATPQNAEEVSQLLRSSGIVQMFA